MSYIELALTIESHNRVPMDTLPYVQDDDDTVRYVVADEAAEERGIGVVALVLMRNSPGQRSGKERPMPGHPNDPGDAACELSCWHRRQFLLTRSGM